MVLKKEQNNDFYQEIRFDNVFMADEALTEPKAVLFPLVVSDTNRFMLKTKKTAVFLAMILDDWLKKTYLITDKQYTELQQRLVKLRKRKFTSYVNNYKEKMSSFISENCGKKQAESQDSHTENYLNFESNFTTCPKMADLEPSTTSCFSKREFGSEYDLESKNEGLPIVKKIRLNESSIFEVKNEVVQKCENKIPKSVENQQKNTRYLFLSDSGGNLRQWSIKEQRLIKNFGQIHNRNTFSIYKTFDGKKIYTNDCKGFQKKIDVLRGKVETDFSQYYEEFIENAIVDQQIIQKVRENLAFTPKYDKAHFSKNIERCYDKKSKKFQGEDKIFYEKAEKYLREVLDDRKAFLQDYGELHGYEIDLLMVTADNNYLFTTDKSGFLKKWTLNDNQKNFEENLQEKSENFDKSKNISMMTSTGDSKLQDENFKRSSSYSILSTKSLIKPINQKKSYKKEKIQIIGKFSDVWSMAATFDSEFLFTGGWNGCLRQWDINTLALVKNYGEVFTNFIETMIITRCNTFLFTSSKQSNLKQWNIKTQNLVKIFGNIHTGNLTSMSVTKDSQHLFTEDDQGELKQWSVQDGHLLKSYSSQTQLHFGTQMDLDPSTYIRINSAAISSDGKWLFTVDSNNVLKQWCVLTQQQRHVYGVIHMGNFVTTMAVSFDNKWLFTIDDDNGNLVQWHIPKKKLWKNHGKIHDDHIWSYSI